ncbi:MAG TPA: lanthionine synthetase LanC family protein [Thermoanaerobaculia bacterium]
MAITDPLVLSPRAVLVPVAELPEAVRRRFEHQEGDFALTHPRLRAPSSILDARSAALLEQFRTPRTIVDAVVRFSRDQAGGADPEATLEEAFPMLERLIAAGFLVAEDALEAEGETPSLIPGEIVAGFEVLECVEELEDTEIHQVRGPAGLAALKIERRPGACPRLAWEAAVLAHLGGEESPRWLGSGEVEGRRYIAMEWCPGVVAERAAWELRQQGQAGRAALMSLCREIASAYARLHAKGVIHGDVHPRNVLVAGDGAVRLVDFGFARWDEGPEDLPRPGRAGVPFFYEPEFAVSALANQPPPEAAALGEQYAVGALLYLLLTGAHYRDFLLDRDAMLRQIAGEPPAAFAERGADAWPEVERLLARALAKSPVDRFPSADALAAVLAAVPAPPRSARPPSTPAVEAVLSRVLDRLRPEGDLFREGFPAPPRASVTYGAAGVACALYRIALAREDAELLSLADLWAARAVAHGDADDGFYDPDQGITRELVGRLSPYHTASGPRAVQALASHALGLPAVQLSAVEAFLAASEAPCENLDLTLGRSGALLAASLLLDARGSFEVPAFTRLTARGDELLAGLWEDLDALPPVGEGRLSLGIAHGWAGLLYASLQWCRAAGRPLPARLEERLAELGECARPWDRGLRWKWQDAGPGAGISSMPGWCNGSAGYVFLFTLAHRLLRDPKYHALAQGAAWNAWEAPGDDASLCCGLAGRAYALLNFHRHGGGPEWLARARELANRAAVTVERGSEAPHSLYKGTLGVAVLAADLARPEDAAMPFFEEEGWSQG